MDFVNDPLRIPEDPLTPWPVGGRNSALCVLLSPSCSGFDGCLCGSAPTLWGVDDSRHVYEALHIMQALWSRGECDAGDPCSEGGVSIFCRTSNPCLLRNSSCFPAPPAMFCLEQVTPVAGFTTGCSTCLYINGPQFIRICLYLRISLDQIPPSFST